MTINMAIKGASLLAQIVGMVVLSFNDKAFLHVLYSVVRSM
jgi:hypothetical protein